MLNKEKYKDELEDILAKTIAVSKSGKIYKCTDSGNCKDCIFCDVACVDGARNWLNSEYKEQILDDAEKEYLSAVIKPFRKDVEYIMKLPKFEWIQEEIYIHIGRSWRGNIELPTFKKGAMYKGMEINKRYTLEELGL